jgi:hypothetical protein
LEATRILIFSGRSQKLELHSLQYNLLRELDPYEVKKHRFVQNAQNIDTVFEELVNDKSFIETCDYLRSYAIRYYQQNKEKAAKQIHSINKPSNAYKRDMINELQIQDSEGSDLNDSFHRYKEMAAE